MASPAAKVPAAKPARVKPSRTGLHAVNQPEVSQSDERDDADSRQAAQQYGRQRGRFGDGGGIFDAPFVQGLLAADAAQPILGVRAISSRCWIPRLRAATGAWSCARIAGRRGGQQVEQALVHAPAVAGETVIPSRPAAKAAGVRACSRQAPSLIHGICACGQPESAAHFLHVVVEGLRPTCRRIRRGNRAVPRLRPVRRQRTRTARSATRCVTVVHGVVEKLGRASNPNALVSEKPRSLRLRLPWLRFACSRSRASGWPAGGSSGVLRSTHSHQAAFLLAVDGVQYLLHGHVVARTTDEAVGRRSPDAENSPIAPGCRVGAAGDESFERVAGEDGQLVAVFG